MKSSTTLIRTAAITAATALVAGSALLVGGAASAATILVPQGPINQSETPYVGWHEGYSEAQRGATTPDSFIDETGLRLTGLTQVINGLETPITGSTFASLVAGAGFTQSTDASLSYQLPIFATPATETTPGTGFTTLRPAVNSTGVIADAWVSSGTAGGVLVVGQTYTAAEIDTAIGDFEALAFGIQAAEATVATVTSISFNGDTYSFFAAPVVPVDAAITIVPSEISPADVANADKGFTVSGVGFAANSSITISFRAPDGTPFAFSSDDAIVTDALGAFTIDHVFFTSTSGVIPAGVFVVVATDAEDTSREATVSVVDPTVPAVVTPAAPAKAPAKALAATGLDDSPLFLSAGLGLLFAGLAAFGLTVVARRRTV